MRWEDTFQMTELDKKQSTAERLSKDTHSIAIPAAPSPLSGTDCDTTRMHRLFLDWDSLRILHLQNPAHSKPGISQVRKLQRKATSAESFGQVFPTIHPMRAAKAQLDCFTLCLRHAGM